MNDKTVIYTARGRIYSGNHGAFPVLCEMVKEPFHARGLIWRLFVREFSARYKQSILGVAWALLLPVATVGMFVVMNRSGVVAIADVGAPYPLYALIGLNIWSLFASGVSACSTALINAGSMLSKINFPKSSLVFAATGHGFVEFFVRGLLTLLVFVWYGVAPDWVGLGIAVILLVPLVLLMLGAGFVLSILAGLFRDVVSALGMVLFGLMLLTPILYPLPGDSPLATINGFNPLNYLVNVPRDMILHGQSHDLHGFLVASLLAVAAFLGGWRLFFLAQSRVVERI